MGLLIKNGEIVNAGERFTADVRVDGGTITDIGHEARSRASGDETIDAAGQYVLPGFVDPHVHMELPLHGHRERRRLRGRRRLGRRGRHDLFHRLLHAGQGRAAADGHRGLAREGEEGVRSTTRTTWRSPTSGPTRRREMREVVEKHGITSFKVFMAYKGALMVDDGQLYQIMREAAKLGAVVTVHAENGDAVWHLQKELLAAGCTGPEFHPVSRPSLVEGEATERALAMARLHGATAYIVHMTCKESVHALERAKLAGQRCYGETCPQYLLLDDTRVRQARLRRLGLRHEPADPARPRRPPRRAVGRAVEPHAGLGRAPTTARSRTSRRRWASATSRRSRTAPRASRTGCCCCTRTACAAGTSTSQRMVELGSTAPARIFGLAKKGAIAVGKDADIVLFDPSGERALSREDAPLEGRPQHLRGLQGARAGRAHDRERPHGVGRQAAHDHARRRPVHRPQARPLHPATPRSSRDGPAP